MTHPLAALIAGVPRYSLTQLGPVDGGQWLNITDVLAALEAATPPDLVAEAGKVLEGVKPGKWEWDGEPWNLIVWDGDGNRVCFMAHSNGLNDARDVATASFIAWCREGVPALLANIAAQESQIVAMTKERDEAQLTAVDAVIAATAAQAREAKLREVANALERAASEVSRRGAETGPQWSKLTIALLKYRAALSEGAGE